MARRVSWTNNSSGHDGTTIHRSTATMDPQALPAPIGTVAAGTTEYVDSEALADGTYYYRVQDYQGASVSAASAEQSFTISTAPDYSTAQVGDYIGGGVYAGIDTIDGTDYHIISGDAASEVRNLFWKTSRTSTPNTTSLSDGLANTNAMVAAGIADHPAAQHCINYSGGGFNDWHMPAINQLVLMHANLAAHPEITSNDTHFNSYKWASTEGSATTAWGMRFANGDYFDGIAKDLDFRTVRPIRRVPV